MKFRFILIAVFLGLTACAPGGEAEPAPESTPAATVTATVAQPAEPAADVPTSTDAVKKERSGVAPPLVTGVRFARHEGFDRVVIDLKGDLTGYTAEYVERLIQDGSGDPIDAEGEAFLQVSLTPANAHTPEGTSTWEGGPIYPAKLENLRAVVRTGDFEAVVGVGLALGHRAPFRVTEQTGPSRIVVDIAH